ncbi:HIT family protein [Dongia rigui]|uniref:HIT family protein n=1 Tax=Dongia rigui TaxID=940149 RepID=A0ABU5E3A2_9PROT|nr:HIT family protein [Dongia rigui]MDY0874067.1 HIT family protein [Dongia rigui]
MSANTFALHAQLSADTFTLGDWPLCRVLRMNDRAYPWLILVPCVPDVREIIDLAEAQQQQLMGEISRASRALKALLSPDKLNVAALGNAVPQLHVHIIARYKTDAAWPRPIWGVQPTVALGGDAEAELAKLRPAFGPFQ